MAEKQIHEKHRQRLKIKADKSGLQSFAEHEILELLLTYSIPRRDTNPIAHELISAFGSFAKVIEASPKNLQKVKGIGKESARFLNYIYQFVDVYLNEKRKENIFTITSTNECVKYFRKFFLIKRVETLHIICLSKNSKVVKVINYEGTDGATIFADTREIASNIADKEIYSIAVFHTHPNGDAKPSVEDEQATQRIKEICKAFGIKFLDHIIFTETEHYSFQKTYEKEHAITLNPYIASLDEDLEQKFGLKQTKKK